MNLVIPSTKFIQCQTIIRNALKSSPDADIRSLWKDSNTSTNIQYDQYRNAKHVLKSIQTQHHHRITEELTSQGLVITSILKYASLSTTSLWSTVQKNMPKNIFNFTLKYLSDSLATRKTSLNGASHNHRHALSVFSLRLCSILFQVVNPILNKVGTLGGMTQFLTLLQTHCLAFNLVLYTLIFLHFYLRLLSLVIPFDLTLFLSPRITIYIYLNSPLDLKQI